MTNLENLYIPPPPVGFKSGFIGIIGRPNVGKSTLLNQLVGQKIAITSPVAQTTRNVLRGIVTTSTAQMILVDTPGIHKPHHQLGEILVKNARSILKSVDIILLLFDGTQEAGGGDRYIIKLLESIDTPVICGINKIDLTPNPNIKETYQQLISLKDWKIIEFSALTETGLPTLIDTLTAALPLGPYYYPPDLVTDQPERFIMGELIREQILHLTREEVPHSVAILIEKVEESSILTKVYATIYVERDTQKAILIGKSGLMLKSIGTAAREQIQKLILGKVYLELFVKVRHQWRQQSSRLAELGYQYIKE